jgi:hypothetical protein
MRRFNAPLKNRLTGQGGYRHFAGLTGNKMKQIRRQDNKKIQMQSLVTTGLLSFKMKQI